MLADREPVVTVMGYSPGALELVAVLLSEGEPDVAEVCVSLLTKPVMIAA